MTTTITGNDHLDVTWHTGDTREVVEQLDAGSIDLVLTSPPFLGLRSYLADDSDDKLLEIGAEATPAEFIDTLLELTAGWSRVLADHGSIAVELGDSYAGSGGAGGDYRAGGLRDGQGTYGGSARKAREHSSAWPRAKTKAMIPELYRVALAYGINPLTGAESPAGRWIVRNVVTWCRPNPTPGATGDKYKVATSDMVIATRSPKRWFDLDAVRTDPVAPVTTRRRGAALAARPGGSDLGNDDAEIRSANERGVPPLDYWVVPTVPYPGSHYAVWPETLLDVPIDSMCPHRVCARCGTAQPPGGLSSGHCAACPPLEAGELPAWRRGRVLDPFGGSGTTGAVAAGRGRCATLIDLDERNYALALERNGLFLTRGDGQ